LVYKGEVLFSAGKEKKKRRERQFKGRRESGF